jgi:hypothetical protein
MCSAVTCVCAVWRLMSVCCVQSKTAVSAKEHELETLKDTYDSLLSDSDKLKTTVAQLKAQLEVRVSTAHCTALCESSDPFASLVFF